MNKHFQAISIFVILSIFTAACAEANPTPIFSATTTAFTPVPPFTDTVSSMITQTSTSTPWPTSTGSPRPTFTPTATHTPTLFPDLSSLKIAYIDGGQLWLWHAGNAKPIMSLGGYNATFSISPDGSRIAFADWGQIGVINVDGSEKRVSIEGDETYKIYADPEDLVNFQWFLDKPLLMLTTYNIGGPAGHPGEDMYYIDLDTMEWNTVFARGEGGEIYLSPDENYTAVVSKTRLLLMNSDGSNQRTILTYKEPQYQTDAPQYPSLDWASDSKSFMIEIQTHDSWEDPNIVTTLWNIPIYGSPSIKLQSLVYRDVSLSPDHTQFVFIQSTNGIDSIEDLHVVDINGVNDHVYYTSTQSLSFMGWSSDGIQFAISDSGSDEMKLATLHDNDIEFQDVKMPDKLYRLHWSQLAGKYFLFLGRGQESNELWIGEIGQEGYRIIEIEDPPFLEWVLNYDY